MVEIWSLVDGLLGEILSLLHNYKARSVGRIFGSSLSGLSGFVKFGNFKVIFTAP